MCPKKKVPKIRSKSPPPAVPRDHTGFPRTALAGPLGLGVHRRRVAELVPGLGQPLRRALGPRGQRLEEGRPRAAAGGGPAEGRAGGGRACPRRGAGDLMDQQRSGKQKAIKNLAVRTHAHAQPKPTQQYPNWRGSFCDPQAKTCHPGWKKPERPNLFGGVTFGIQKIHRAG